MTGYELNDLPRSTTGKRMFSRVSPVYDNSFFMKSFYEMLGADWDILREYFTTLRQQRFIPTVDWGIDYQEKKYSIVPDPTLSLEERRARLGIKAFRKYPLNPAVLEAYALENFDLNLYLDESDPGYIHLLLNHANDNLEKFLKYLLVEKPAHLALKNSMYFVDYIGYGGTDENNPRAIYVPEDLDIRDDSGRIIRFNPDLIPQTVEDKKKFPRLYAGIAELTAGVKEISLPKPKDIEQKIFAGNVLYKSGLKILEPSRPKDLFQKIYAAQVLQRSGEITIDSADDVPHHDEHQTLKRSYKLKFFAGFGHGLFGMKTLDLPKPPDLKNKLHVGLANVKRGEISIDFDRRRNFLQEMKLRAAQAVVRAGEITIDTATRPSVDPEYRAYSSKVNLHAGIILSKLGAIKLDALRQSYFGRERAQIHVGQVIIKAGEITIGCAEETFPDVDAPLDGNFLRLYFDYATGRDHPLLLKDPRDDLIIGDVKTLGDFSADEKIFVNDDGEYTLGIHQADLISGYNVQKTSDFEKIPSGDALRLFFDFATGNKRKILVRNQKENLTAGDLKTLGNVAAQNKVLINAYGESTRGLTHAAVIKRFKVGAHNADEEIKF